MNQYKNPNWWTKENDSAWDRTKAALKRDWDQTKHDFGGKEPDTNQKVGDTVKQAAGKEADSAAPRTELRTKWNPPCVSVMARAPITATNMINGMTKWKIA